MKIRLMWLGLLCASFVQAKPVEAPKKLNVVTTLGVLRYLADEIGKPHVQTAVLADPGQDPHFVVPRPTLMKKARNADVFIEIGLSLELWGQKTVDGAGNPKIQIGQPGRIVASTGISTLEVPRVLSRDWGDVHPNGNPHIWLDPINVKKMAANIASGLTKVDPAHEVDYKKNLSDFNHRMDVALFGKELLDKVGASELTRQAQTGNLFSYLNEKGLKQQVGGWLKKSANIRGQKIVTYHKTWIYFAQRFGLEIPTEIEEKPGIPPSARHRDEVVKIVTDNHIKFLIAEPFYDSAAPNYIVKRTGAKLIRLPIDVPADGSYFALIDNVLDALHG